MLSHWLQKDSLRSNAIINKRRPSSKQSGCTATRLGEQHMPSSRVREAPQWGRVAQRMFSVKELNSLRFFKQEFDLAPLHTPSMWSFVGLLPSL